MGRAMMSRPKLLMLDEPSMGLSPLMMKRIMSTSDPAEPGHDDPARRAERPGRAQAGQPRLRARGRQDRPRPAPARNCSPVTTSARPTSARTEVDPAGYPPRRRTPVCRDSAYRPSWSLRSAARLVAALPGSWRDVLCALRPSGVDRCLLGGCLGRNLLPRSWPSVWQKPSPRLSWPGPSWRSRPRVPSPRVPGSSCGRSSGQHRRKEAAGV
jgi:hypothetical protein